MADSDRQDGEALWWPTVLGWLARRRLTRREVAARLERHGVPPALRHRLVTRLVEEGWIDEVDHAKAVAQAVVERGRGPAQVWEALARRGFDRPTIRRVMQELAETVCWRAVAESVAARYDRNDVRERRRLAQKLDRMGFSTAVIEAMLEAQGAPPPPSGPFRQPTLPSPGGPAYYVGKRAGPEAIGEQEGVPRDEHAGYGMGKHDPGVGRDDRRDDALPRDE
ncbi:MAG: recombination regulator RecX [Firmicutes bacterium]|nr:regulatory protein RecX [Alicyclobacillaceae bacterium]MCL6496869.1 recombination regulator RecX [Bacillota bacterium]